MGKWACSLLAEESGFTYDQLCVYVYATAFKCYLTH